MVGLPVTELDCEGLATDTLGLAVAVPLGLGVGSGVGSGVGTLTERLCTSYRAEWPPVPAVKPRRPDTPPISPTASLTDWVKATVALGPSSGAARLLHTGESSRAGSGTQYASWIAGAATREPTRAQSVRLSSRGTQRAGTHAHAASHTATSEGPWRSFRTPPGSQRSVGPEQARVQV